MSEDCWIFQEPAVSRLDEIIMLASTAGGYTLMFLSMLGVLDMFVAMAGMAIPFATLPILSAYQRVKLVGYRAISLTMLDPDGNRYFRDVVIADITPLPAEGHVHSYKITTIEGYEFILSMTAPFEKTLLFSPGTILRGDIEVEIPVADVYARLISVEEEVPRLMLLFASGMEGPLSVDIRENISALLLDMKARLVDLQTKAEFLSRENEALEAALALAQARAIANIRYAQQREKRERINTALLALLAGLLGFFLAYLLF